MIQASSLDDVTSSYLVSITCPSTESRCSLLTSTLKSTVVTIYANLVRKKVNWLLKINNDNYIDCSFSSTVINKIIGTKSSIFPFLFVSLSSHLSSGHSCVPENPSKEKVFITDSSSNRSGSNLKRRFGPDHNRVPLA